MLGEYGSMTFEDAYRCFMTDELPSFVQAAGEAIPPDPLPVPVPEADREATAAPGPPGCEMCED